MGRQSPHRSAFRPIQRACHEELLELDLLGRCSCHCLGCGWKARRAPERSQGSFDAHARAGRAFSRPEDLKWNRGLADAVRRWLAERNRQGDFPSFVTVGLSAEPLPGHDEVESSLIDSLRALLTSGVGISLQTRRGLPDALLDLLAQHADRCRVIIPLPSLDARLLADWEPGTASPSQRLWNVQRLSAYRIPTLVHLKPLIPYVTDEAEPLARVVRAAREAGARQLGASFLRLTKAVRQRLAARAPVSTQLLFGAYADRPLDERLDRSLPQVEHRRRVYRRVADEARRERLRLQVCACDDPVLGRSPCLLWPRATPSAGRDSRPGPEHARRPAAPTPESTPPPRAKPSSGPDQAELFASVDRD